MDFWQLEQYVLRCPLQALEFRHESGVYTLGNFPTKPAWWYVIHEPGWESSRTSFEVRGLNNIVTLIERIYPELYAWLVVTFPDDGVTQR
jgi:hypothetical protein